MYSQCLSEIVTNSLVGTGKNYHPQVFSEECKHIVKEKKMPEHIIDKIEISHDDSNNVDFKQFIKYLYNSYTKINF